MDTKRYTIRSMPLECIQKLRDVRNTSGVPIGVLVSDAVGQWWDTLPVEEVKSPMC